MPKPLSSVINRPVTIEYNEDGCYLVLMDRDTGRTIGGLTIDSLKDEDGNEFRDDFGDGNGSA